MSFEKSVKGATKIKLAPPKAKYTEHILRSTHGGEAGVAEVFRALQPRLRDPTWTIAFKALIVIHLMIRDGEKNVTLSYLSTSPRQLTTVTTYTDVQTQGRNIRHYSDYLCERAGVYQKTKVDYVLDAEGRLKRLTVDKGLLRETECVQRLIYALLKCDLLTEEPENEITLTAFRVLVMDLLALFHVMNEGAMNVLEHYFEMSKPDAERALTIYKTFAKQTDQVVRYLSVARQYQHATRVEVPKIRHAPTSLVAALEDYLNDKDFEINRRQYLAQQEAKKGTDSGISSPSRRLFDSKKTVQNFPSPKSPQTQITAQPPPGPPPSKGPPVDLMDFFESIEQNQQPMATEPVPYQQPPYGSQQAGFIQQSSPTGVQQWFVPQQTNSIFGQSQAQHMPQQHVQPQFTGAGFGGYTQQAQQAIPPPQQLNQSANGLSQLAHQQFNSDTSRLLESVQPAQLIQPQSTNPFRQSSMPGINVQVPPVFSNASINMQQQQPPNPSTLPSVNAHGFMTSEIMNPPLLHTTPTQNFSSQSQSASDYQPQQTHTNPFARSVGTAIQPLPTPSSPPFGGVASHATGSTNPFRQSAFVNQQTGQAWQTTPQGTMGGFETLPTVPVFPRPNQPPQSAWQ